MAGDDNRGVIDAREQFLARRRRGSEKPSPEERTAAAEANQAKRLGTLEHRAGHFRKELDKAARLSEPDRIVLVRNLGRLVERAFKGTERRAASAIFKRAYGEESSASMDKKRKRYMRFDGELLPSNAPPGEYHAHGKSFLKLVEAFLQERFGDEPTEEKRWRTLDALCEGASFAEPQKPRVFAGADHRNAFRSYMRQMVDVVAHESDIVTYLDEVRRFTVKEIYAPRGEMSRAEIALRGISPKRFEYYIPKPDESWKWEATQLSLDGFDNPVEEPSYLLPRIRLGRIFWPRHMLCLPVSVEKKAFDALDTEQQQSMLRDALRTNGNDPENLDWERFQDPKTGEAREGAKWHRFYQARGYDLVLTAEHDPQNLRLGLFTSLWGGWDGCNLVSPCDDLTSAQLLDFSEPDDLPDEYQVMRVGRKYYIAKGLGDPSGGFGHHVQESFEENFVDVHGDEAWNLLSVQMEDWRTTRVSTIGHALADPHVPPALRPCFDAPDGWAPAPDRSLASAMLRSLSLAKGAERLDQMLIQAVNVRVECLARMKDGLEQTFERGLMESGYKP